LRVTKEYTLDKNRTTELATPKENILIVLVPVVLKYIGLTQENSIENSIQDCLPYILKAHGPCYVLLAYPK